MKTPSFWYKPSGFLATLLSPLGWIYGKGAKVFRSLRKTQKFSIPLISVGGITCGGSGKTPVAIALAALLQAKGHNVHFVTRGYKGTLHGPVEVKPHLHTAYQVGDEPLLLAQQAPTWVAKKRALGIQAALNHQAEVIILDDGHQTLGIDKDLSFVVIDFFQGLGNGHVFPAGPLREELQESLKRAEALIGVGKGEFPTLKPVIKAHMQLKKGGFTGTKVVAFCGLGFPQKFYKTLQENGFQVAVSHSFPDHHTFTERDLLRLSHTASSHHATLVTTRKDWIRLPAAWQDKVQVIDAEIHFEDKEQLYDFILATALLTK